MALLKVNNAEGIKQAIEHLSNGEVVALPTETVYGLAGSALNGEAIAKIYEAKGRPSFNPLIVHVPDIETARKYGDFSGQALTLASLFWPGPLTIIVKQVKACAIHKLATAGLDTIALRVPAHPDMRAVLKGSNLPLAAPSANASGGLSPTSPKHVLRSLSGKIPMVLAGGGCDVGLESSVIDMSSGSPTLLRPGAITKDQLSQALGCDVAEGFEETKNPKSPGLLMKHYAPSIPIRLKAIDVKEGEALLAFGSDKFMGIAGGGFAKNLPVGRYQNLSPSGDLSEAAANLFGMLHALDKPENKGIAVMDIPDEGLGVAINNRLKRAVSK